MPKLSAEDEAYSNFENLKENPYPGRGIVVGLSEASESLVQIYWLMGRSENSRNRVLKKDHEGRVYTQAADPSKMKDPSLIIYNAMRENPPYYAVSNGHQTDAIVEITEDYDFLDALSSSTYEPDAPIFTQRISALSILLGLGYAIQMSILRKSRFGEGCDRSFFEYLSVAPGLGYCITTYAHDGNPPPPLRGEPYLMPLLGEVPGEVAEAYWSALNEENRVAIAVKFIERRSGRSEVFIINRHE